MTNDQKLEALLFVSPKGLNKKKLCQLMEISLADLDKAITNLKEVLEARALELVFHQDTITLATKKDYSKLITKLQGDAGPSLTQPMLETLAIIAYQHPVEKLTIDNIRGVDSVYTIKALIERGLVKRNSDYKYTVTKNFLLHLGLNNIDELPKLNND